MGMDKWVLFISKRGKKPMNWIHALVLTRSYMALSSFFNIWYVKGSAVKSFHSLEQDKKYREGCVGYDDM